MSLFCLVHGGWEGAWCWELLISELEARGHHAIAMDLPIENPEANLSCFAQVVLEALQEIEEDIVLVGHSMAGTFIPLVAKQLPIRRLVFLNALIPYPGMSTLDQCNYQATSNTLKTDALKSEEWELAVSKFEQLRDEPYMLNPALRGKDPLQDRVIAMEFFFHDCKTDIARWAISKLRTHKSSAHLTEVFPLQTLPSVEYSYIVCSEDRILYPEWSRYAARKRLGIDAIELPGGHYPHLSRPDRLADVLVKLESQN